MNFLNKIRDGLKKTRDNIVSNVEAVFKNFTRIDDELFDELEEALIAADIGAATSMRIIGEVRDAVKKDKLSDVAAVRRLIVEKMTGILTFGGKEFVLKPPAVILIIGVNGAGKTTAIGKLAHMYKSDGNKVLLAAGDTFRAAAIDQLDVWAKRAVVDIIKHQEHSDPGAVVFDAVAAAKARGTDLLIVDTAGRLHNKKNLMEELRKINRIIEREYPETQRETFLVLDATTGQNALAQARIFGEIAELTGIILTKLDGTAKGGVVIAIKDELDVPVRFIGVGEGINDLHPFDPAEFAAAIFGAEEDTDA